MAAPTLASVSPTVGPSGGDFLLTLSGSGFNVPESTDDPSFAALDAVLPPTVLITFEQGGKVVAQGLQPQAAADGVASCLVPALPTGTYDVAITNLDDDGTPRSDQRVLLAGAFQSVLPQYGAEQETDLTRTVRELIRLMKRQLLVDEVNYAVQTDYDATSGDELHITKFASLPGIAIAGPELRENRFYSLNDQPDYESGDDGEGNPTDFVETRVPYTVDLIITVVVASDNKLELLNLQHAFLAFMHKNKWLVVTRTADPASPTVRYELDFEPGGQPKVTTVPNDSNIRSFTAEIVVRGFDVEYLAGMDAGQDAATGVPNQAIVGRGKLVDEVVLDPTVQIGVSSA